MSSRRALDLLTSLKFSVGLSLEFEYNFCTVRYCCWSAAYGVLSSFLFHRRFYLVQNAFIFKFGHRGLSFATLLSHA